MIPLVMRTRLRFLSLTQDFSFFFYILSALSALKIVINFLRLSTDWQPTLPMPYKLCEFIPFTNLDNLGPECNYTTVLGRKYTMPGLQAEKNNNKRAHHKYKKNIAMTDCLIILCPACRQPVIAISIFCLCFW